MKINAKLLFLVVLIVGTVSVAAQTATKHPTTQPPTDPPTCPPVTGNTCRIELAVTQCNTDEPLCPRSLGLSSYKPAKSCREIFRYNPSSPSGYYWLKSASMESREVYCDMDTTHCNTRGGWMRVAYLNMTEPGASCPTSLRQINTPAKLCGRRTAPGCSSVTYPVDGIRYSKVCGQARGYQYYTTDGFKSSINDINSHYVDGVSITYGNPRQHIWTYVSGLSDNFNYGVANCPCAKYPGAPPAFVGLYYFCESGITGRWEDNRRIALDDPLGVVMGVVQATAAVHRLGCRGSVGASHRK